MLVLREAVEACMCRQQTCTTRWAPRPSIRQQVAAQTAVAGSVDMETKRWGTEAKRRG